MKRFVILSVAGILLLGGSTIAFILWDDGGAPGPDRAGPTSEGFASPAPVVPPAAPLAAGGAGRPAVIAPPPPSVVAPAVQAFENPPPKAVPLPPAPPPPFELSSVTPALESHVKSRCGTLQVRIGDDMRAKGEAMTGQALLLYDVDSQDGSIRVGQGRLQAPGNMRPALVACAQLALQGQVFPATGATAGKRFTLQVVLGLKE